MLVDKEEGISGVQQYNATKKIFLEHGIHTSRVTHGGRHAGAMEAESLGIPIDSIKKGGGWKDRLGRLETHYLGKVPSEFARGMAGFWNKPFGLERNRVDPPLELQQEIFPWIENYFGENNADWKKECLDEMNQIDENEFNEDDTEAKFVEENVASQQMSEKRKGKQKETAAVHQTIDAAKRGFLKLLIRCRRIILQDSAVYLILKKENGIVNTYPSSNNLFISPGFRAFQQQIQLAINTPTNDRLQEYECLVPHIVDSQNEVSSKIAGFGQQLIQVQHNLQQNIRQEVLELKQQLHSNQQNVTGQNNQLQQYFQQTLSMQQLILTNLQFLTNQRVESIVSTNSASVSSSLPFPSLPFLPSAPAPLPPPLPSSNSFLSSPLPPIASSSRVILPAPSQTENAASSANTRPSKSTKRKYQKKEKTTKWVNYSLD